LKQAMVDENLITTEKLKIAMTTADRENEPLSKTLVNLGFITDENLVKFIGEKINIPYVNVNNYTLDRDVLELIPHKIANRYNILPLFKIEDTLTIAMPNPHDIFSIDDIRRVAKCKVESVIASESKIKTLIDRWYGMGGAKQELIDQLADELKKAEEQTIGAQYVGKAADAMVRREAEAAPIIKLVHSYIAQAILEDASDIHFGPKSEFMMIRFRIDGFLYERHHVSLKLILPIISRIKIMSDLDISKKKIPQDGRIHMMVRGRSIDIRTSTLPSMYGENVVLRILDKSKGIPTLSEIGFSNDDLIAFKKIIKIPSGMILATGTTGSGKTTTIFSGINSMNTLDKNIMTIEDPIEYEIEGIVQSQIDHFGGVTFESALKSILRQDPDIIYVGEIRDKETAELSIRAALTGHLVISTLHTSSAVGAITRLRDIGVSSRLIGSVLNCAFGQRLVRKICPRCKLEYRPDESLFKNLRLPSDTIFHKGEGCEACGGIGYKGRIGIFEILNVEKNITKLINNNTSEIEINETGRKQGMKTLFEDGLLKVKKGITTIEEVLRVIEEE